MVTFDVHEALFGCNHLECFTMMPVASCTPFALSTPCNDMFAMLVCATRWLSMHLYTLAYMSMPKSCLLVCHPCFNTMKLWTSDPNLHLSLTETTICLLSCLFAFLLVCLFACLPFCLFACYLASYPTMPIMLICFMPFCIFSIHCLSASFLSLPSHAHTWNEDA